MTVTKKINLLATENFEEGDLHHIYNLLLHVLLGIVDDEDTSLENPKDANPSTLIIVLIRILF